MPRHVLITWTTSFFISNLVVFYALHAGGMAEKPMGILFFIWIGIFNYFVIAQFWGFANDLYTDEAGKRTFPLVALGASLGGLIATLPFMKKLRDHLGGNWQFKLMLIAGIVLGALHRPGPVHPPAGRPQGPRGHASAAWPGRPKGPPSRSGP